MSRRLIGSVRVPFLGLAGDAGDGAAAVCFGSRVGRAHYRQRTLGIATFHSQQFPQRVNQRAGPAYRYSGFTPSILIMEAVSGCSEILFHTSAEMSAEPSQRSNSP